MSTQFVTNFAIPGTANVFQLIWKATRAMKAAGWTVQASSDGVAKDTSGVQTNDKWGAHASPLADVYVTDTNNLTDATSGGWIVMRGPSTIKVPLSANPTGTFLRGETVNQATSGAEGELLGYVWDTGTASGYAVIMPHTGTFDATHVVTGASSGATFTPTGTVVTYVREIVISRDPSSVANAKVNGWIWYICADVSGESASLPTTLAASAGCTATIPPGGGGTSNAFPSKGLIIRGTSSAIAYTGWITSNTSTFNATSNGQIWAANATPGSGISADGSFYFMCTNTSTAGQVNGIVFTRLDDAEPGDVDPYVFFAHAGLGVTNWQGTTTASTTGNDFANIVVSSGYFGYAARGASVTARDLVACFTGTGLYYASQGVASLMTVAAWPANLTLLNHPSATPPAMREPVAVHNAAANSGIAGSNKQFKGRCRWIHFTTVGTYYDTYDSKAWICCNTGASAVPVCLLPYDGATTPIQ